MAAKEHNQNSTASSTSKRMPESGYANTQELIQEEFQPLYTFQNLEINASVSSDRKIRHLQRTYGNQAVGRFMKSSEAQDKSLPDTLKFSIPRLNPEIPRGSVQRNTTIPPQDVFFRSGIESQHRPSNDRQTNSDSQGIRSTGLSQNVVQHTSANGVIQRGRDPFGKKKAPTPEQIAQSIVIIEKYYIEYKQNKGTYDAGIIGAYYGPPKRSLGLIGLRTELTTAEAELNAAKINDNVDNNLIKEAIAERVKSRELGKAVNRIPRGVLKSRRVTPELGVPLFKAVEGAKKGRESKEKFLLLQNLDRIYSRHLDHFGEKWDAQIADQYEEKDPHPNAAANPGNYHTGAVNDPIPIMWYKAPQDYANVNGNKLTTTPKGSVKVGNYHRLGVDPQNIPKLNWIIQKAQSSGMRGNQVDFNKNLMWAGYSMNNLDGDHVLDLGFGGQDTDDNYWPLDATINRRAFNGYNKSYVVHYLNNMNQVKAKAIGGMIGRWFKVKGFLGAGDGAIPAEAYTENAGKV